MFAKNKKIKGSVLVFTLIILSIMLVAALAIGSATVNEVKNASATDKSTQAFQAADSGAELAIKELQTYPKGTVMDMITNVPGTLYHPDTVNSLAFSVPGNNPYAYMYLLDKNNSTLSNFSTALVSQVAKIHSVGTYSGTTRAVDAPVCFSPIVADGNTVGLWHFSEGAGGTVKDSSGQAIPNNGTVYGTTVATGVCNARNFNGTSSDYITVPFSASSSLNIPVNQAVTMEALINPVGISASSGTLRIFSKGTTGNGYGLSVINNTMNVGGMGGGNCYGTTILNNNQWYYVVGIINSAPGGVPVAPQIYINGKIDPLAATCATVFVKDSAGNSGPGCIGCRTTTTYGQDLFFNGLIDEVKISKTPKSATSICQDYNNIANNFPNLNLTPIANCP